MDVPTLSDINDTDLVNMSTQNTAQDKGEKRQMTFPIEVWNIILKDVLADRVPMRLGNTGMHWKPVGQDHDDAQAGFGDHLPGDEYIDDDDQYDVEPNEGEAERRLVRIHAPRTRLVPIRYWIHPKHADAPLSIRSIDWFPEILSTCQVLHAEGTYVLEKPKKLELGNPKLEKKPAFIKIITHWSPATWHQLRTACRSFEVHPWDVNDDDDFDCVLHIVRGGPFPDPRPLYTVLIMPQDFPHFMRYAHLMDLALPNEMNPKMKLAFPQTVTSASWGFEDDASFVRFLSESVALYATLEPETPGDPWTIASGAGGMNAGKARDDADIRTPDLKSRLTQWVQPMWPAVRPWWDIRGPNDMLSKPWLFAVKLINYAAVDEVNVLDALGRMLDDAESLVEKKATYVEITSALQQLKYVAYMRAQADLSMSPLQRDNVWKVYAWCCFHLATIDGGKGQGEETVGSRRNRLRWAHLHASQALALPSSLSSQ